MGVDVLHVPRLRQMLMSRSPFKFGQRILSATEWTPFESMLTRQLQQQAQQSEQMVLEEEVVRYLAVRLAQFYSSIIYFSRDSWAVKEATYKAGYPRWKWTWKDVSLVKPDGLSVLL